jgi:hypothetical protein
VLEPAQVCTGRRSGRCARRLKVRSQSLGRRHKVRRLRMADASAYTEAYVDLRALRRAKSPARTSDKCQFQTSLQPMLGVIPSAAPNTSTRGRSGHGEVPHDFCAPANLMSKKVAQVGMGVDRSNHAASRTSRLTPNYDPHLVGAVPRRPLWSDHRHGHWLGSVDLRVPNEASQTQQ